MVADVMDEAICMVVRVMVRQGKRAGVEYPSHRDTIVRGRNSVTPAFGYHEEASRHRPGSAGIRMISAGGKGGNHHV